MTHTIPPIADWQLALAIATILIPGVISLIMGLGLLRTLFWATVRTFAQLSVVGYALSYLFAVNNPLILAAIVALMVLLATQTALSRSGTLPFNGYPIAAFSLALSTYLVGFFVCAVLIRADPWHQSRIAIPIAGMILGNSLSGIALALERFCGEIRTNFAEVEQRLCLGYTCWQASVPHLRIALKAGMTPMINALMIAGLVSIPGMMTGQILAGADPVMAARYQIVMMITLCASVAIGALVLIGLSYRRFFTADGALRELPAAPR